ncbi:MAG: protein TolR [Rickettsiales bacterium]|nr:protein TolR [Rickettsiales bacterium]OUV52987.1 MAG: protein TolR [Rickettsiales bacterium TMED127]|tara:strand:- start:86816 stop:87232 length:417 start_codon:yes stop_codon:yes gene_type:complete
MGIHLNKKQRGKRTAISEINVTPFVDVMLVLLIIFMVTAPLLTAGIKVNLPESNNKTLSEKNEPITVSINKKGEIFLQKQKVSEKKLMLKLFELKKQDKNLKIYIRGDKDLNYGDVISIMGKITKAGFKKVALVTKIK